jgi:hypothetical protein
MTAAKKRDTKSEPKLQEQPKPAAQPQPQTTTAQTKPAEPSRQEKAIKALIIALGESGVKIESDPVTMDGKFALVRPWGPAPTIKIGPSGSYDIIEVKSFAKADLPTMVKAKELYDKRMARQQKKAAETSKPATPAPQGQTAKTSTPTTQTQTPTQRKKQADSELERQLQHA